MNFAAVLASASLLGGCSGNMSSHLTEYGKRMRLVPKPEDCPIHVVHEARGIAPHVPIAKLTYEDGRGWTSDGPEMTEAELGRESCRLGADGFIIDKARYRVIWVGTKVEATGVDHARITRPESNRPKRGRAREQCRGLRR